MEQTQQMQQKSMVPSAEDRVLKVAMNAFDQNIMKYLGQKDHVKRVAPTEQIHLEARQLLEDFNYEMKEGYWRHYEFESDRITVSDMRRFREYESFLSMTHRVPVITTVLCSAKVKKLRSKIKEGINTYRVETVHLKDKNADKILKQLQKKVNAGAKLSLDDLVPMLLTPLMSGDTSVYERICQGFDILKKVSEQFEAEDIRKMQAILYTFACKFLSEEEVGRIKEVIGMTRLGELLMNDGIAKGRLEGRQEGRQEGSMISYLNAIAKGLSQKDAMEIAAITEETAAMAVTLRKEGKL